MGITAEHSQRPTVLSDKSLLPYLHAPSIRRTIAGPLWWQYFQCQDRAGQSKPHREASRWEPLVIRGSQPREGMQSPPGHALSSGENA